MKKFVLLLATVAVAMVLATPAFAKTHKKHHRHHHHAHSTAGSTR